jgi:hypothetical protein
VIWFPHLQDTLLSLLRYFFPFKSRCNIYPSLLVSRVMVVSCTFGRIILFLNFLNSLEANPHRINLKSAPRVCAFQTTARLGLPSPRHNSPNIEAFSPRHTIGSTPWDFIGPSRSWLVYLATRRRRSGIPCRNSDSGDAARGNSARSFTFSDCVYGVPLVVFYGY